MGLPAETPREEESRHFGGWIARSGVLDGGTFPVSRFCLTAAGGPFGRFWERKLEKVLTFQWPSKDLVRLLDSIHGWQEGYSGLQWEVGVKQIFSDYVRSLEATGEPSDNALNELWIELRRMLRRALQRRGLWDRPPSYAGVMGDWAWITTETADRQGVPARAQDALDELTTDFYVETFVERLQILRRYAERGDSLERVVHVRIRQFLHQRQRQADPLGHRLFQWLREALQRAVDDRRLHPVVGGLGRGRRKVDNDTAFSFVPDGRSKPATDEALAVAVERWNDDLLVAWATARSDMASLVADLEAHILELREVGIEAFVFKNLVDVFKRDARDRLAGLLGDPALATTHNEALDRFEQRGRIHELSECVVAAIHGGGGQRRTRRHLLKLWRFLVTFALAADDPDLAVGTGADAALAAVLEDERLPSNRKLGRLLGVRRDRLPALFARLKEEAGRCLAAARQAVPGSARAAGGITPDTLGRSASLSGLEAIVDKNRDLRQQLKRLTAEAYRRDTPSPRVAADPAPGALYHLEDCPEPGIEWLLLEVATAEGLLIPADSLSWIGSADVGVIDKEVAGSLSLRGDLGVWLGLEILSSDRRTGAIGATDLERVRSHRRQPPGETATIAAQEIDCDPDYLDWRRTLEGARNAVARVYGGRLDEAPAVQDVTGAKISSMPRSEYSRASWRYLAVAASIVVTAGALVTIVVNQHSELSKLRAKLEAEKQPESAIPWLLAPLGATRGTPSRLEVPSSARSIGLLIDAANGDQLEVRDAAGQEVWSSVVERIDSPDEALVRMPAELMPPGEYVVKVSRGDVVQVEFELLIEPPRRR